MRISPVSCPHGGHPTSPPIGSSAALGPVQLRSPLKPVVAAGKARGESRDVVAAPFLANPLRCTAARRAGSPAGAYLMALGCDIEIVIGKSDGATGGKLRIAPSEIGWRYRHAFPRPALPHVRSLRSSRSRGESALIWRAAKQCHSHPEQLIRHAPAGHCANDGSASPDNAVTLRQGFGLSKTGDSVRSSGHRLQTFLGDSQRLTVPRGTRTANRRNSHTETGLRGLPPPLSFLA